MENENLIDISKLNKADVFRALYNKAVPLGIGIFFYTSQDMTKKEAKKIIKEKKDLYFDYYNGRVMKVDLNQKYLDPRLYDRDNGKDAAKNAIKDLNNG